MIIMENLSEDSILIVEKFITGKRMIMGKGFIPCQSDFPHDCIDSSDFLNNDLQFYWITPDKYNEDGKIEFKKFKIKLQ